MDNQITLSDGNTLTLDPSMTIGYLLSRGARRTHYSQISTPRRNNAALPTRPVTACGRAVLFGHSA